MRIKIGLKCSECGDINYTTYKNSKTTTEKVELKKLLLKMKNVNKIEEIKKLYDEFILIRRLGYVW